MKTFLLLSGHPKGLPTMKTLEERSFIEIGSSHQKQCIFDKVVSPNKGQYNNCGPSCRPTWGNGLIATCTCLGLRDGHLGRKCFGCKGECLSGSRIDPTSKSKHVNNNVKLTISWLIHKLKFNCWFIGYRSSLLNQNPLSKHDLDHRKTTGDSLQVATTAILVMYVLSNKFTLKHNWNHFDQNQGCMKNLFMNQLQELHRMTEM